MIANYEEYSKSKFRKPLGPVLIVQCACVQMGWIPEPIIKSLAQLCKQIRCWAVDLQNTKRGNLSVGTVLFAFKIYWTNLGGKSLTTFIQSWLCFQWFSPFRLTEGVLSPIMRSMDGSYVESLSNNVCAQMLIKFLYGGAELTFQMVLVNNVTF